MTDVVDILQEVMDWKKNHASAYEHLVKQGQLSPTNLASWSDVPKGRIYDILSDLEDMGAVEYQGANPKIYDAQHPEKIIDGRIEEFEAMATEAKQRLIQPYERNLETPATQNPAWVLTGRSGVVSKVNEQIEQASEHVWIRDSNPLLNDHSFASLLDGIEDRNLNVQIVGGPSDTDLESEWSDSEISVTTDSSVRESVYLFDDDYVLFVVGRGDTGVIFRDRPMASVFAEAFQSSFSDN